MFNLQSTIAAIIETADTIELIIDGQPATAEQKLAHALNQHCPTINSYYEAAKYINSGIVSKSAAYRVAEEEEIELHEAVQGLIYDKLYAAVQAA